MADTNLKPLPVGNSQLLARTDVDDLELETDLAIGKLHIFGDESETIFARIAGVPPPRPGSQSETDGIATAWLAPGEWLVSGSHTAVAEWLDRAAELGSDTAFALDISHGVCAFVLSGAEARNSLAAHCPLDLWHKAFPVGAAARSLLGDTGLFVVRLADKGGAPRFRLIIDQVMEAYAVDLLSQTAGRPGPIS